MHFDVLAQEKGVYSFIYRVLRKNTEMRISKKKEQKSLTSKKTKQKKKTKTAIYCNLRSRKRREKMKKIIILVSVLVMSSLIFAQSASIYDQVGVPTYQARELYIQGADLLNFHKQGDDTNMAFGLDAVLNNWCQKADFDIAWGNDLTIDYTSNKVGDADAVTNSIINENLHANATKYFGLFQAFGNMEFNFNKMTDIDATKYLNLTVGAGVGRIYDATPIAQAIVILKKLGAEITDEKVLEIMDIINSEQDFIAKYKDSCNAKWFEAIATAAGDPGGVLTVAKVLTINNLFDDAYYPISPRMVGWEVTAAYSNQFLTDADPAPKGDLNVWAGYAKPLGLDKSLMAYMNYWKSLEEEPMNFAALVAGLEFWMDHDYNWASNAGLSIVKDMTADSEADMAYEMHIETVKNILGQLYGGAKLSYMKDNVPDSDAAIDFNIYFKYFIF
jgi:hypothetical protein